MATRDFFSQTTRGAGSVQGAVVAVAQLRSAVTQCGAGPQSAGAWGRGSRSSSEQHGRDHLTETVMQKSAVAVQCGSGPQHMGTQTRVRGYGGERRGQQKTARAKQARLQSKWATLARFRLELAEEVEGKVRKRVWGAVARIKRRHAAGRRIQAMVTGTMHRFVWRQVRTQGDPGWTHTCNDHWIRWLMLLRTAQGKVKTRKKKIWRDPTGGRGFARTKLKGAG